MLDISLQVDSIDHMITNISRDMIMSVHNKIEFLSVKIDYKT